MDILTGLLGRPFPAPWAAKTRCSGLYPKIIEDACKYYEQVEAEKSDSTPEEFKDNEELELGCKLLHWIQCCDAVKGTMKQRGILSDWEPEEKTVPEKWSDWYDIWVRFVDQHRDISAAQESNFDKTQESNWATHADRRSESYEPRWEEHASCVSVYCGSRHVGGPRTREYWGQQVGTGDR